MRQTERGREGRGETKGGKERGIERIDRQRKKNRHRRYNERFSDNKYL